MKGESSSVRSVNIYLYYKTNCPKYLIFSLYFFFVFLVLLQFFKSCMRHCIEYSMIGPSI